MKQNILIAFFILIFPFATWSQTSTIPNKKAPKELIQFQFLVGEFDAYGKIYTVQGYNEYQAKWKGYYILNGFVFVDEFAIIGNDNTIYFLGITYRTFNSEKNIWEMRFFDALTNEWLDDFNGKFENNEINGVTKRKDANGQTFISKIKFYNISSDSFTWKSDRSYNNGKTWIKNFGVIKAKRLK